MLKNPRGRLEAFKVGSSALPSAFMAFETIEPLVIRFPGGVLSVGYLGHRRFRLRSSIGVDELETKAMAMRIVDILSMGVTQGPVSASRAPLSLCFGGRYTESFVRDERMIDGSRYLGAQAMWDGITHDKLAAFIRELLGSRAEELWAHGVEPIVRKPLGRVFSFENFCEQRDPKALCEALASCLEERMQDSASPEKALEASIDELCALGHDLCSWDFGREWGWDYMQARPGAGLRITWPEEEGMAEKEERIRILCAFQERKSA